MLSSQLSGHCDVITNQLWRHQQNLKWASETRGWYVKILVLAPFMDSLCHVRNKIMYVLLWRTVYALKCYFGVYFLSCCTTWEINTKITLSWAHKQFATRVHALFSIYSVHGGSRWSITPIPQGYFTVYSGNTWLCVHWQWNTREWCH